MSGLVVSAGASLPGRRSGSLSGSRSVTYATFAARELSEFPHRVLQRAKKWWFDHRFSECGRPMPPEFASTKSHDVQVAARLNADLVTVEKALMLGLLRCRNKWGCPVCTVRWRQRERAALQGAVEHYQDLGHKMSFVVLTSTHAAGDSLRAVMDWQADAWRGMVGSRAFKDLLEAYYWAWDIVVGGPNGPHPHRNLVFVWRRGEMPVSVEVVRKMWLDALEKKAPKHGFDFSRGLAESWGVRMHPVRRKDVASHQLAGYVSKDPHAVSWEAVDSRFKSSRGGSTLWELLYLAGQGDERAGRVYGWAMSQLKGRSPRNMSKTFRKVYDERAMMVMAEELAETVGLLEIDRDDYEAQREAIEELGDEFNRVAARERFTVSEAFDWFARRLVRLGVRYRADNFGTSWAELWLPPPKPRFTPIGKPEAPGPPTLPWAA